MAYTSKLAEFRKWFTILLLALVLFFGYQYFSKKDNSSTIEYDTALIQSQIKNVAKLVVTEGHFSEVLTYKDQRKTYIPGLTFDKKALVVVNAEVTVAFDMSQLTYDIDAENKTLTLTNIPEEEIKIYPELKYYDVESSRFNEFTGSDYNKVAKIAKANIAKKIEKSTLKSNAKNRLISELSKLLIVTKSMGWKLEYQGKIVENESDLTQKVKL
ncbi:DUF4230 domain-containing protein [Flavobacterium sp. NG2]|uniref:DUF4230 domain-containing protein n=1 Tax=Flavobacterium sp. NG2 TaxID=3097547 RepID=UPI002A8418B1|nr:DUF4230 domain-containing protein [Flavobacterium sp. NG2]WPR72813.1 DUF4230 domain-containing protein [Flavobacterium sp. NG2]